MEFEPTAWLEVSRISLGQLSQALKISIRLPVALVNKFWKVSDREDEVASEDEVGSIVFPRPRLLYVVKLK